MNDFGLNFHAVFVVCSIALELYYETDLKVWYFDMGLCGTSGWTIAKRSTILPRIGEVKCAKQPGTGERT